MCVFLFFFLIFTFQAIKRQSIIPGENKVFKALGLQ